MQYYFISRYDRDAGMDQSRLHSIPTNDGQYVILFADEDDVARFSDAVFDMWQEHGGVLTHAIEAGSAQEAAEKISASWRVAPGEALFLENTDPLAQDLLGQLGAL